MFSLTNRTTITISVTTKIRFVCYKPQSGKRFNSKNHTKLLWRKSEFIIRYIILDQLMLWESIGRINSKSSCSDHCYVYLSRNDDARTWAKNNPKAYIPRIQTSLPLKIYSCKHTQITHTMFLRPGPSFPPK